MFILPNQRCRRIVRRSFIRTNPGARTFFEVASSDFGFAVGLLQMSTEFVPHRGQELVGKVRLAPRTESLIKRRRENWGRCVEHWNEAERPEPFYGRRTYLLRFTLL